uniref:ATP synthase F0 subunit 8 n=1 Tax=Stictochironomus rosenschoeldi TaxID=2578633 RepID=UPI0023F45EDE|nr:ATP synthase F0 subunit 8 [Stictochironomus rosenschoeldi]WEF49720.1 ATP synthase F0 subunit 8 [Stictochironomus rosenschoeldi]
MPQMSPMMWTLLFIFFISLFLLFNILNYFNFIPELFSSKPDQPCLKTPSLNWKW